LLEETQAIAASVTWPLPGSAGCSIVHVVPFQDSASGVPLAALIPPPTATQLVVEAHDTALRAPPEAG
jgi:hypothetical protein